MQSVSTAQLALHEVPEQMYGAQFVLAPATQAPPEQDDGASAATLPLHEGGPQIVPAA
jgi:hypothetical protein